MNPDSFYYLEYLDNCFYLHGFTHNLSADKSFGFFQVYHVKLSRLHRTSNGTLYLIYGVKLF